MVTHETPQIELHDYDLIKTIWSAYPEVCENRIAAALSLNVQSLPVQHHFSSKIAFAIL